MIQHCARKDEKMTHHLKALLVLAVGIAAAVEAEPSPTTPATSAAATATAEDAARFDVTSEESLVRFVSVLNESGEHTALEARSGVRLSSEKPGASSAYVKIPRGESTFKLVGTTSEDKIDSQALSARLLTGRYTLIALGDIESQKPKLRLLSDFPPALAEGEAALRLVNMTSIGSLALRLGSSGAQTVAAAEQPSGYLKASAGTYEVRVMGPEGQVLAGPLEVSLEPGVSVSLLVFQNAEEGKVETRPMLDGRPLKINQVEKKSEAIRLEQGGETFGGLKRPIRTSGIAAPDRPSAPPASEN